MLSKVWYEISYTFPNFNGCAAEVWEWISYFTSYDGYNYLSMLGFKLHRVSKGSQERLYHELEKTLTNKHVHSCRLLCSLGAFSPRASALPRS